MYRILLAVTLMFSLTAVAADISYTRFLVPFYAPDAAGAHGSQWHVETWLHYSGDEPAYFAPVPFCFAPLCPFLLVQLSPGYPALPVWPESAVAPSGILFHAESRFSSKFVFESRIKDLTRQRDSAGTEIPVIREDRITNDPVFLLNVPRSDDFRILLRIYALPEVDAPEVEVRYYRLPDASTGAGLNDDVVPLRDDRVQLRTYPPIGNFRLLPSAAEVANIESLRELAGYDAIWIEVVPVTPGLRLWAFVSLTNNTTQQVTVVTPVGS
jgi:hypothetical protein